MNTREFLQNSIEQFALPGLTLEEEIDIAATMEECRDRLLKPLCRTQRFFRIIEEICDSSTGKGNTLPQVSIPQRRKKDEISILRRLVRNHSTTTAGKVDFNYMFIARAAEQCGVTKGSMETTRILQTYYHSRDRLVRANAKEVLPYCYKYEGTSSLEDLFQTAIYAMVNATGRYSRNMGYKFGTFATWWVRQELQHYIRKDSEINVPFKDFKLKSVMEKKIRKQEQESYWTERNPIERLTFISETEGEDGDPTPIFEILKTDRNKDDTSRIILKSIIKKKLERIPDDARYMLSTLMGIDSDPRNLSQLSGELRISEGRIVTKCKNALKKLKMEYNVRFPK